MENHSHSFAHSVLIRIQHRHHDPVWRANFSIISKSWQISSLGWVGARETHLSNRTCYSLCLANYNLWPRSVGRCCCLTLLGLWPLGEGFRDSSGSSNSSSSEAARSRSLSSVHVHMMGWWDILWVGGKEHHHSSRWNQTHTHQAVMQCSSRDAS